VERDERVETPNNGKIQSGPSTGKKTALASILIELASLQAPARRSCGVLDTVPPGGEAKRGVLPVSRVFSLSSHSNRRDSALSALITSICARTRSNALR
jgi:hypothetical protein